MCTLWYMIKIPKHTRYFIFKKHKMRKISLIALKLLNHVRAVEWPFTSWYRYSCRKYRKRPPHRKLCYKCSTENETQRTDVLPPLHLQHSIIMDKPTSTNWSYITFLHDLNNSFIFIFSNVYFRHLQMKPKNTPAQEGVIKLTWIPLFISYMYKKCLRTEVK